MATPRPTRDRSAPAKRPPLDCAALERIALHYAGRYATTRHRLGAYLARKLKERGWAEEGEPPVAALVERFAAAGYVDDRSFAAARAGALSRRGLGGRRIAAAMRHAGVEDADAAAVAPDEDEALAAAIAFARRRRLGPFGPADPDPDTRRRAFGAMMRAGHDVPLVRRVLGGDIGEAED